MSKARQNLRRRIARLGKAVFASSDPVEQERMLGEQARLVERREMSVRVTKLQGPLSALWASAKENAAQSAARKAREDAA